jgi:hypothetical protein
VEDFFALAHAAHFGAGGLAMGSAIRFLIAQYAHMRGDDTHDDIPMKPTMYELLGNAMTTLVFQFLVFSCTFNAKLVDKMYFFHLP